MTDSPVLWQCIRPANLTHVRFTCLTQVKEADKLVDCGGQLTATLAELMDAKKYPYRIKCPKCQCEFSRSRRAHFMSDQPKAVAEMLTMLKGAAFRVDLAYPCQEGPQQPAGAVETSIGLALGKEGVQTAPAQSQGPSKGFDYLETI